MVQMNKESVAATTTSGGPGVGLGGPAVGSGTSPGVQRRRHGGGGIRRRRRAEHRVVEPLATFRTILLMTLGFVVVIMALVLASFITSNSSRSSSSSSARKGDEQTKRMFHDPADIPEEVVGQLDAVLVLGGGVPSSLAEPPVYVQRRCNDVASVLKRRKVQRSTDRPLAVLCLSAGTAHLPQLLSADGLPIWESTSSAAYLVAEHGDIFAASSSLSFPIYVETTSYDTIGNAYYARTGHTDVAGWRKLLVVTSEFHMDRSRAIFDWIFALRGGGGYDDHGNVPDKKKGQSGSGDEYTLYYLSSPNDGLSDEAVEARKEKEASSLRSVREYSQQYKSMRDVWQFLNERHGLYTANKLIERGRVSAKDTRETELMKKSYGAS